MSNTSPIQQPVDDSVFPGDQTAVTNDPAYEAGALDETTLNVLEAQLLQRRRDLLAVKAQMVWQNPLEHFIPFPQQHEFFEAAAYRRRAVFSGNRFGKTTLGVVEDCCHMLGYRPFFREGSPLRTLGIRQDRGVKGLCIAEDWDKVGEVFTNDQGDRNELGYFFQWLAPNSLDDLHRHRHYGIIDRIRTKVIYKGQPRISTVYFDTVQSWRRSKMSAESSWWDFIHVDEPLPEGLWEAHARGLIDSNGSAWFLLTPLEEAWIHYMFTEQDDGATETKSQFWFMQGSTDDNPTLDAEAKDLYFNSMDEETRACRRDGVPRSTGRLIWWNHFDHAKQWLDKFPGWTDQRKPPPHHVVYYAIDPHPKTPHAILFLSADPFGNLWVYDEIFEKARIDVLSDVTVRRITGLRFGRAVADPLAWIVNPETETCWAETFIDKGLWIVKGSKQLSEGLIRVADVISQRPPCIFFGNWLTRTKFEMKRYHYKDGDKPADEDDHMMENLRRLIVLEPHWWDPAEDTENPVSDIVISNELAKAY